MTGAFSGALGSLYVGRCNVNFSEFGPIMLSLFWYTAAIRNLKVPSETNKILHVLIHMYNHKLQRHIELFLSL